MTNKQMVENGKDDHFNVAILSRDRRCKREAGTSCHVIFVGITGKGTEGGRKREGEGGKRRKKEWKQ